MNRPLQLDSITDLAAMAERNWDDKAELGLILSELKHRSTKAAVRLRERVEMWIRDCENTELRRGTPNSKAKPQVSSGTKGNREEQAARWTDEAVAKLRAKLIDLSRKSPLIAFKHSSRSASQLRFIDERPDLLFDRLSKGGMGFEPLPGEEHTPADERTPEFGIAYERARLTDEEFIKLTEKLGEAETDARAWQDAERALRGRVRAQLGLPKLDYGKGLDLAALAKAHGFDPSYDLKFSGDDGLAEHHDDDAIRVLLVRKELDRRLKSIADRATSHLRETGHHTLHLAFGFVQWFEDDTSDIVSHAPLLLLPVALAKDEKRVRKDYRLHLWEGGLEVNVALVEKAREHWGLHLPKLREEESPESYFIRAKAVLDQGRRLTLRNFITLSVLPPMVLWRDLDPSRWPESAFAEHRLLPGLVGAMEIGGVDGDDSIIDIDDPANESRVPALITDADASQHRAIMDMAAGRDMAIEGPPGTGKSQTITNMIATALAQDKRVLFVAEKQAALRVVSDRLRAAGFGPLLLELHGDKASRADVYSGVRERLNAPQNNDPRLLDDKRTEIRRHRDTLRRYLGLIRMPLGKLGQTAHALAWREVRLRQLFTREQRSAIENRWTPSDPLGLTSSELAENREILAQFAAALRAIDENQSGKRSPWTTAQKLDPFDQGNALEAAAEAGRAARAVALASARLSAQGIALPGPNFALDDANLQLSKIVPLSCDNEVIVAAALHKRQASVELLAAQAKWNSTRDAIAGSIERPDGVPFGDVQALHESLDIEPLPASAAEAERERVLNINLRERIDDAKRDLDRVGSKIACGTQTSVRNAAAVVMEISKLGQADQSVAALLSLGLIDVASKGAVASASREVEALCSQRDQLSGQIQIEAFGAEPAELEEDAHTIDDTGALARLFSSRYKAIWRRVSRRVTDASDRSQTASVLRLTASFLRQRNAFVEKSNARGLFPALLWEGMDSDFASLRTAQTLVSELASQLSAADEIEVLRWWLVADAAERQSFVAACERLKLLFIDLIDANYAFVSLENLPFACETRLGELNSLLSAARTVGVRSEALFRTPSSGSVADALISMHEASQAFDEHRTEGGFSWSGGVESSLETLSQSLIELDNIFGIPGPVDLRAAIETSRTPVATVSAIVAASDQFADAALWWKSTTDSLNNLTGISANKLCGETDWEGASELLTTLGQDRDGASLAADLLKYRDAVASRNLELLASAASAGEIPTAHLGDMYELLVSSSILRSYLGMDGQELGRLGSLTLDAARQSFKRVDKELHKLEANAIVAKRLRDKPPVGIGYGRKSEFTELRLLENEIELTRPRTPLRDVAHRAGTALQVLKPVWMMSPTSIAQFIRPGSLTFDLLIVDEASQMRPEFSVSCIMRADQFVVVGDANQLPPSDHFQVANSDDDGDEEVGVDGSTESILDLANQRFRTKPRLRWHYRSQHESLIQFSNREFYDRDLVVFPSPAANDDDLLGVKCTYVPSIHSDTIYDSSINQREAELIIEQAFGLMQTHPERSIGIVAMNAKQTELIQNEFERLIVEEERVRKYVEAFAGTIDEFFIKNLENVQGDERDIILISSVYGPNKEGVVRQNFGLMNRETGWRRLNVLVTRAKISCQLITSLRPDDIKITENSSRGVLAFKSYLTYAHGGAQYQDASGGETDSDFEIFVADALRNAGYEVVYQVGVENFKIDLGIRHESCPLGFIAGIECDGATYHTGLSVRDRDHIRQTILESLGWNIYRVWSTDWFADSARETAKLLVWLDRVRERVIAQLNTQKPVAEKRKPKQKPPSPPIIATEVALPEPVPDETPIVSGPVLDDGGGDAKREPRGRELRALGDFQTYEAIRGRLYEIWRGEELLGEVEVVKRATAAPRLYGDRVLAAQSEYEGRVVVTGDSFRSFDLYAAMREVASRAANGADEPPEEV